MVPSRSTPEPAPPAGDDWRGARLVVQVWLGTRLVLALVAGWVMLGHGRTLTDVLGNWDVQHFLAIASDGYANPQDIAFFPGWPLLLRGLAALGLPPLLGGTALALAGSALAAAALYRLAGPAAAIAWLLAPTAVFTTVPYTEGLFCAAAFWAWERARSRHWAAAAALAAVAAGLRVSGVFLVAALAVLALSQGGPWTARLRRLGWLVLPALVVAGYLAWLKVGFGSWTAWFDVQADNWARGFTWPWESLRHTLDAGAPGASPEFPEWAWLFRAEVVSMAVGAVVTVVSLARRRWGEAGWVGLQVLAFSTSWWFMSVNRAVLLWFPLWVLLGRVAEGRGRAGPARPVLVGFVVVAAVAVQALWGWLFFTGRWAS
ncbi:MAG TPA: mannosyltransferase family protein [Propionicimonas sp.]|nr:mannosyltransferase family protein [Propionicimonas sp.]